MSSGRNGPRFKANTRYGFTEGLTTKLNLGEVRDYTSHPP